MSQTLTEILELLRGSSVLIYRVHEATEQLVYSNRISQLDIW
jgi:hypothetical protein